MTQPGFGYLRASDADRERAVDMLKAAFAEGRLTQDEYTSRVGRCHTSQTYGDLAELLRDLPSGPFSTLPPAPGYQPAGPGYPAVQPWPVPLAGAVPPAGIRPYPPAGYVPPVPYYPGMPRPRDPMALSSMVLGVVGLVFPPTQLAAIGLGIASLVRMRTSGSAGRNFAVAGIALGLIGLIGLIILIAVG